MRALWATMHSLYDGENIYSRRKNAIFMEQLKIMQPSMRGKCAVCSAMMRFIVLYLMAYKLRVIASDFPLRFYSCALL